MEEKQFKFDSKILSSAHIHFLFGAGVNGKAFPQLELFAKTIKELKKYVPDYDGFENSLNSINKEDDKEKVYDIFKEEFKEYSKNINYDNESINNIKKLFAIINKLIDQSENRTKTTKQVNIYSLNYDYIIENSLNELGFLVNSISYDNYYHHDRFFDMIGYNNKYQKFMPTYLVLKLHGSIDKPIFPGNNKYDDALQRKRFELFFTMKEKLSKYNSVLFVIGYSGRDEHINEILNDCVAAGLTIYWFKYRTDDYVPLQLSSKVQLIENNNTPIDTTKLCGEMIEELWIKSLEE